MHCRSRAPSNASGSHCRFVVQRYADIAQQHGRQTRLRIRLNPLQHQRNALPHTDAHGAQRIPATGFVQLVDRRGHQARA